MLRAPDIRGMYAIIPTPAKPGAERLDATDTVDLGETARVVDQLLRDGTTGIIALGTTGECATLTQADYEAFVDCVLATVNKRVPTFIGTTALGGQAAVKRMRFVRERGADGTLLGLPMWQPCTTEMAVKYYAEMSEVFPDLAIMVYANARAFRFDFSPEFWGAVARQAPTVMAAKYSNAKMLPACLAASGDRINYVPNEGFVYRFAELSPATTTACWATAASMGPQPVVALMDALLSGDMARAKQISDDCAWAGQPVDHIIESPEVFASYNIQLEKIRIDAAGYCKAGPVRPPYDVMPEEYAEQARECGRRWAQLCQKYAAAGSVM
ncbi:MAG TPA: dihydrodipicolinate synthase family protein [Chloroflexota bacterium]|nr:dihydrodipicolinate synthase family protein [Chloroflexota bacterium]